MKWWATYGIFLGTFLVFSKGEDYWVEVDRLVEEFQNVNGIPGVAFSLVNATQGVTAKGYGLMDTEAMRPMENDTRFLIASISKSFTAIATCRVLSQYFPQLGETALDTPIMNLDPTFNLTLIDRYRTEKMTFRDLLSHRSCLNSYGIGVTAGAYKSRADRLYRYRYIEEKCAFRSRFEYSNAMFILAGEIVAHIANVPFENLVTQLLIEIGMNSSLIVTPTEDYETLENMSRGYYRNFDGQLAKMNASVYNSNSGAAAGGIISTAADMGRYILFHMNKGQVEGKQIVDEQVMEWLYKSSNFFPFPTWDPFFDPSQLLQADFSYGLGLDLGLFGTWSRVSHDGDLSPFTSRLTFYPQLGLGLFTVINGPGLLPSRSDHLILHNQISQVILGTTPPTRHTTRNNKIHLTHDKDIDLQNTRSIEEVIDPSLLVGLYGHPYEGDVTISLGLEGLELEYGIWGHGVLVSTEVINVYDITWKGDIVAIFLAYNGGPPLPNIQWDFNIPDTLLYVDSDGFIAYRRNATIETYPEIPWESDTCGI